MILHLSEKHRQIILADNQKTDSAIDNGATYTHLRYIARVYSATRLERLKTPFLNGIDYLLRAQYTNGGWPQFYPNFRDFNPSNSKHNTKGLSRFITFNDHAMIGVMSLLDDITKKRSEYIFVDEDRRKAAEIAVQKGVECILNCQIIIDGKLTAWCAQHDEHTYEPRWSRVFEPAALSSKESVGIVSFLMKIDNPSRKIIESVHSAVAWLNTVKINGIRLEKKPDESTAKGFDWFIIEDPNATFLWSRFYEIGTNRPIFCSRDDTIQYSMAEISKERRTGYNWYGYWPLKIIVEDNVK